MFSGKIVSALVPSSATLHHRISTMKARSTGSGLLAMSIALSLVLRTVRMEDVQEFYSYWKARRGGTPVVVPEEGPAG